MVQVNNPIEDRYDEFLGLIKSLCVAYDSQNNDVIALSISTAIRVLVHDTNQSTSLLTHLKKKDCKYLSTNTSNKHDLVHLGLVRRINAGVNDGVGGEAKYWPLCDDRYFPVQADEKHIHFNTWWSGEKVFKSSKASLTRKDIILSVANKDGGAHFDTKVQDKYDHFRKTWSGGTSLVG
ncbi:MAG: hypothetical protein D3923_17455, partial [Candidatus Electrothrix sp. AR3]|nr:hypothetical protein [Candidatus Electrothrix sp. AR3]